MYNIELKEAMTVVEAALRHAETIRCPMSVAVVDTTRELVAFARQPGAKLASAEIAHNKAYTARSLEMTTAELAALTRPGQPLYGIETAQGRPFVAFAGGRPLWREGVVFGAVGVSGGTVEQDDEVAQAGEGALT